MRKWKYSNKLKRLVPLSKKGRDEVDGIHTGIVKTLLPLALPLSLLVLSYIFFLRTGSLPKPQQTIIQYASYVIFFMGMTLSCCFNRYRIFFILAILTVSQLALIDYVPGGVNKNFYLSVVYPSICLLIPVNISVFSLLKERGILTSGGKVSITFILIQIIYIAWIIGTGNADFITAFFSQKLSGFTAIPPISLAAFLITFLLLLVRQFLTQSPLESSFIGVLFAAAVALHFKNNSMAVPVFFSASGMMLIIAVIQDSYSKAYLDELTGLPSRRALREEIMKLGKTYAIAMLDIDHFKKFNDTYGHDVGDDVLKLVATIMKDVTGGGKAFRYGGEEFTILFPGKNMNDVIPHLDQLRDRISKRGFTPRGKDRPKHKPKQVKPNRISSNQLFVTVSIGVSVKSEKHKTADDVIKAADSALYRAKEAGRNRVSK